jgi:hypothetical protein
MGLPRSVSILSISVISWSSMMTVTKCYISCDYAFSVNSTLERAACISCWVSSFKLFENLVRGSSNSLNRQAQSVRKEARHSSRLYSKHLSSEYMHSISVLFSRLLVHQGRKCTFNLAKPITFHLHYWKSRARIPPSETPTSIFLLDLDQVPPIASSEEVTRQVGIGTADHDVLSQREN